MSNPYALKPTRILTAPNGARIRIYNDNAKELVPTVDIAKSLGYSAFTENAAKVLTVVFKNHSFNVYRKALENGHCTYCNETRQIVSILQAFIELSLLKPSANPAVLSKQDDARMEAARLIEFFSREVFGELQPSDNVKGESVVTSAKIFSPPDSSLRPLTIYQRDKQYFIAIRDLKHSMGYSLTSTYSKFGAVETSAKRVNAQKYNFSHNAKQAIFVEANSVPEILGDYIARAFGTFPNMKIAATKEYQTCENFLRWFNATVMPELYGNNVHKQNATVEAAKTAEVTALPIANLIETIEDVPPYGKEIGIYELGGKTFICADELSDALDDCTSFAFDALCKAADKVNAPKYQIMLNDSIIADMLATNDVDAVLGEFLLMEPKDSVCTNALTTREFLREYKYFPSTTNDEYEQEGTQMENSTTNQATLPPVTVADIEDISERAEATVKVFGVSKADALRAVTQLKAQEINRDLTPLLELLDGQKK